MSWYSFLTGLYNQFLAIFPPQLQWLVTVAVLVGLVVGFFNLIKNSWWFLLLAVLLLPVIVPALQHFFTDLYAFFQYLLSIVSAGMPR